MEQTPAFALKLDKIEAAQANVEAAVQRVAALGSDALRSALTNERHTPSTQLVEAVLACMQLLIDKTPDLAAAKKLVRRRRFVRQLRGLEISHVPRAATLMAISRMNGAPLRLGAANPKGLLPIFKSRPPKGAIAGEALVPHMSVMAATEAAKPKGAVAPK